MQALSSEDEYGQLCHHLLTVVQLQLYPYQQISLFEHRMNGQLSTGRAIKTAGGSLFWRPGLQACLLTGALVLVLWSRRAAASLCFIASELSAGPTLQYQHGEEAAAVPRVSLG